MHTNQTLEDMPHQIEDLQTTLHLLTLEHEALYARYMQALQELEELREQVCKQQPAR